MRKLTTLLLCATLAVSLAACGRKNRPAAPEGSMYPRVYPPVANPQRDLPKPQQPDEQDTDTTPEASGGQPGTEIQSR